MDVCGVGGFGTVCAATHRTTKAKRAVKMVSKASLSKQDSELLLKELALLKEIDHPNILKILEHYEDEQHHFFVTEYEGGRESSNCSLPPLDCYPAGSCSVG